MNDRQRLMGSALFDYPHPLCSSLDDLADLAVSRWDRRPSEGLVALARR